MSVDTNRRKVLKYAVTAIIAGAIAGAGGYFSGSAAAPPMTTTITQKETVTKTTTITKTVPASPTPPTTTPLPTEIPPLPKVESLVWAGGSWAMYPSVEKEWERLTDIDLKWTAIAEPEMLAKQVATGGKGMDIMHPESGNFKMFLKAGIVQPIPLDKLAWYKKEDLAKCWREPENVIGLKFGKENAEYIAETAIKPNMWWPGKEWEAFACPPRLYNFDSICWNPEFIDFDVHSWGSLFDRQFKGKTALQDIFVITINEVCAYLVNSGQMEKPEIGINNLKPSEVDIVIDFLIEHKKAGQFKAFWPDYGAAVNLHVTREVWISDGWQPVEYDVRRGGVPCYYAEPDEGYRNWYSGDVLSSALSGDKLEVALWFVNWITFGGWHARWIVRNGYFVCSYPSERVKQAFEIEYYDWHYGGQKTYLPWDECIKVCWPDRPEFWELPERQACALFIPERNKWSTTPGKPHPKGIMRDGGDFDRHMYQVATWQTWPDYADYYAKAWDRLKAA